MDTILESGQQLPLWIDQICIDQSNAVEKSQQVHLMRSIYQRATNVYIWLGPASDDSDDAIAHLEDADEASMLRDFSDARRGRLSSHTSRALECLLNRPYWRRVWTIQEATALDPRQTLVFCGDSSIRLIRLFDWEDAIYEVMTNPVMLAFSDDSVKKGPVEAFYLFRFLRNEPSISLATLLDIVRQMEASDPRDKIYSILSFVTDVVPAEIKPDYTKSVHEAYTEYALWYISRYHCLDVLGECYPSLKDDKGPSWVPDLRSRESRSWFPKVFEPGDPASSALYRASGNYVSEALVHQPLDGRSRLLLLSGVKISHVGTVPSQVPHRSDSWAALQSRHRGDGDTTCPLNGLPIRELFRRTVYRDIKYERHNDRWKPVRGNGMVLPWDTDDSNSTPAEKFTKSIARQFAEDHCLFYTTPGADSSQGLLGYGPNTTTLGDELWMLKGGKVLYILRSKSMKVSSTDLRTGETRALPVDVGVPTYELVGEIFVLGLMDGEIFDMLGNEPKRERPAALAGMDRSFRTIGLI